MSLLQQRKAEPIDYWPDRRKRRRSPVGAAAGRARFDFGSNWSRFLAQLDGARIAEAETSLKQMLETPPRRTGKPENPSPAEMKKIWKDAVGPSAKR